MQAMKEKAQNMASAAREHVEKFKAKAEEKTGKATARTEAEEEVAKEQRKAKEAEAKAELHEAKARHKMERENAEHAHAMGLAGGSDALKETHLHHGGRYENEYHADPPVTGATVTGPAHPVAGHPYPRRGKYL